MIEIISTEHVKTKDEHIYCIIYFQDGKRYRLDLSRDFELTNEDILEIIKNWEDA